MLASSRPGFRANTCPASISHREQEPPAHKSVLSRGRGDPSLAACLLLF